MTFNRPIVNLVYTCSQHGLLQAAGSKTMPHMKNLYYLLKPFIPWGLRMTFRRMLANRLRHQFSSSWPIHEPASRAPQGWPGWPHGEKFAFVLTHDVEGMNGFKRCKKLAEMDKALGFRSSFNFVPEGEYTVPESLRFYLEQEGFEVGVHFSTTRNRFTPSGSASTSAFFGAGRKRRAFSKSWLRDLWMRNHSEKYSMK